MTQYLNKSFSVYANANQLVEEKCTKCNTKTTVFNLTIEGRLCDVCYQKQKQARMLQRIEEAQSS